MNEKVLKNNRCLHKFKINNLEQIDKSAILISGLLVAFGANSNIS